MVEQYYADISAQDYADAWNLGGSNLSNGVDYDQWAAGDYTTTGIQLADGGTWTGPACDVEITASQSDGSTKVYQGTYTVYDGVIQAANMITQTGDYTG